MLRNSLKIYVFFIFILATGVFIPHASSGYQVSGLVEFTYNIHETKAGNNAANRQNFFTQTYFINFSNFLVDPRFLIYSLGASYNVIDQKKASLADSTNLNYNANFTFFPTMRISWNIHGSKGTSEVQETPTSKSYDVENTVYGGSLNLRLKSANGNGNNNRYGNNNNNNNGSGGIRSFFLPTIGLHYSNTERRSLSTSNPLHEVRDNTTADLSFANSGYTMLLNGGIENYEDKLNGGAYEYRSAGIQLSAHLTPKANFRLDGDISNTTTAKLTGYDSEQDKQHYHASLYYRGDVLDQDYQFDYIFVETPSVEFSSQSMSMTLSRGIARGLTLRGGLNYGSSDFKGKLPGTTIDPIETSAGSVFAGLDYQNSYTPEFLGPFALNTRYTFAAGTRDTTNGRTGATDSGEFYSNSLTVGLDSRGWMYEFLGISYNLDTRRDKSILDNDSYQQKIILHAKTTRIPKTTIDGTIDYITSESSAKDPTGGYLVNVVPGVFREGRTVRYSLTADYIVSYNMDLGAGMTRNETQNGLQSLMTLQPSSRTQQMYETTYARARFYWLFTRRLTYNAELRWESRRTTIDDVKGDELRTSYFDTSLNYQLRQVLFSLMYQLRQDDPEVGEKFTEQRLFAKLSRRF